MNLKNIKEEIKFIAIDVDGTLTDGGVYITENGDEFKKFNTKDGIAIKRLIKKGFQIGIISASISKKIVFRRAEMLGVKHCYVGNEDKTKVLNNWLENYGWNFSQAAFLGDDINDYKIMKKVGLAVCPADAVYKIKEISDVVLENKGGHACLREFADRFFDISEDF